MTTSENTRIRLAMASYFADSRQKLGITQREIADTLKVHVGLISRIETASTLAGFDTATALVDLFAEHYKLAKFVYRVAGDESPLTTEQAGRAVEHLVAAGLTCSDIARGIGYTDTTVHNMRQRRGTLIETRVALYRFAKSRLGSLDFTQPVPAAGLEPEQTVAVYGPPAEVHQTHTVRTPASVRCKLVAREKLADELTFDGTPYTFQSLPDGQILVTKGA